MNRTKLITLAITLIALYSPHSVATTAKNVKCSGCVNTGDIGKNAVTEAKIKKISTLSTKRIHTRGLKEFEKIIVEHENIIAKLISLEKVHGYVQYLVSDHFYIIAHSF